MTQEELKNIILTHVNFDGNGRAEVEQFFSECDDITIDNCMEKLWEWRKNKTTKYTPEGLKKIILTHVNLDEYSRIEIDQFFAECEGITVDNCMEKLWEWRESKSGKDATIQIGKDLSNKRDSFIQKGLTAIQRNNYSILEHTHSFGTYIVKNNETGYFGLIAESGEEILPCIFNTIYVVDDMGYFDVGFKGVSQERTHSMRLCDKSKAAKCADRRRSKGFIYGDNGGYLLILSDEMDERTKQLVDLLNINHSVPKE